MKRFIHIQTNIYTFSLGKYVIRLFWMGCWREVTVDDLLPVNDENCVLLPSFVVPKIPEEHPKTEIPPSTPQSASSKSNKSSKRDQKSKKDKKDKTKAKSKSSSSKSDKSGKKGKKDKKKKKETKEEQKVEMPTFEIWPFLLSKALLKIASLTWSDKEEIVDFDIVHCLTGWIAQRVDTKGNYLKNLNQLYFLIPFLYFIKSQRNERRCNCYS